MRKYIILLALCLASSLFAGCGAENEYGDISDVDISEEATQTYEEDSIFIEADDDLGYNYVECDSKKAQMRFQIPANWEIAKQTQRYIQIVSPEDDPIIPGCTLNIQHRFGELSEYENNTPSEFEELFTTERSVMEYTLDGTKGYVHSHLGSPTKVVEHTEISSEENTTCLCVYENAWVFKNYLGDKAPYTCTAMYEYVKWENQANCFSLICNSEHQENAEKLLTYITSTIKLSPVTVGTTKQEKIGDITFTVPKEFEKTGNGENAILRAPLDGSSYFGGSAIAVVDLGEVPQYNEEYMLSLVGKDSKTVEIVENMLGVGYDYVLYPASEPLTTSVGGKPTCCLSFTCDIFSVGGFKLPLQPTTNAYLDLYCYDDGGKVKAIALLTSTYPYDAAASLINLVESRTKIS